MFKKKYLHLYEFRYYKMRVLFIIIWTLALAAVSPLEAQTRQANNTAHATKQKEVDPIEISAYDNKIVVENVPIGSKLEIYSVVGIKVKEIPMKQTSGEYTVDIAKGYYIIRIGDTVRKVAIR